MQRLVIVMAMAPEAAPLVETLGATALDNVRGLPMRFFGAQRSGAEVVIACNGHDERFGVENIATQPAVLNAYVSCERFAPDLLISAGTAGGWSRTGGAIGDVYLSERHIVFHDRRIEIPNYGPYGVGSYPVIDASVMAAALGLKTGVVTTGNSLDETDDDRRMIAASGACVKDMEAAAVAWVAEQLAIPMLAVKAITDLVDAHAGTVEQFDANLAMASSRLCDALLAVVDWCAPRTVAELGGHT